MIVRVFTTEFLAAEVATLGRELLERLLKEKVESLAKLYDVDLSPPQVNLWMHPSRIAVAIVRPAMIVVDEMYIRLQLTIHDGGFSLVEILLANDELMDYVAFCVVMGCRPKIDGSSSCVGVDELITYYTLKYGYKDCYESSCSYYRYLR